MTQYSLEISAPEGAVKAALEAVLTDSQLAEIRIRSKPENPFEPSPQRDLGVATHIIEFAGNAIVGGALYDLVKVAYGALKDKFGDNAKKPKDADGKDVDD